MIHPVGFRQAELSDLHYLVTALKNESLKNEEIEKGCPFHDF